MMFTDEEIRNALHVLQTKYPDHKINMKKTISGGNNGDFRIISNEKYDRQSMKRSNISHIIYDSCIFKKVAFTGSMFNNTFFNNSQFSGSGFSNCNFYRVSITSTNQIEFDSNTFSQSNLIQCNISNILFISNGFLNTLFDDCYLENLCFQSNTLEGSQFNNSRLHNVDFGNVNIEFVSVQNSQLDGVIFPFYQLAYIIGIANEIQNENSKITVAIESRHIPIKEYKEQIEYLIIYYWNKSDYFAMCNLYIVNNDLDQARKCLRDGINTALVNSDFRMIRHFCRLARYHDLLDEDTTQHILTEVDHFLYGTDIPSGLLNEYIINTGEIREILLRGNISNISLKFQIRTNVGSDDENGREYINSLCTCLHNGFSNNNLGQNGFEISISCHSPIEIFVDVVTSLAGMTTIIKFIWDVILYRESSISKKSNKNSIYEVDKDIYTKCLSYRLDKFKSELKLLMSQYDNVKLDSYIEEITQNLITDISELYDKDIILYKKKND